MKRLNSERRFFDFLRSSDRKAGPRKSPRSRSLRLESLEDRQLLSATPYENLADCAATAEWTDFEEDFAALDLATVESPQMGFHALAEGATASIPDQETLDPPTVSGITPNRTSISYIIETVEDATDYIVECSENSNFTSSMELSYSTAGFKTIFDLSPETTYYFRVKAIAEGRADSDWTTFEATALSEDNPLLVTMIDDYATENDVGSIRYAIANAGTNGLGTTITFAESLKGQTITLDGSALTISRDITIDASSLWDAENNAPGLTIDADQRSSVFVINGGATLVGLEITNGSDWSHGWAGGINITDGTSHITNCRITNNYALEGGGVSTSNATTYLNNCVISDNSALSYGGGFCASYGSTYLTNCTVSGNTARETGGIYAYYGTMRLTNCELLDNYVDEYSGGALTVVGGTVGLTSCRISGNSAQEGGGGLDVCWGGAATLTNCEISNNCVGEYGGGLCVYEGTAALTNCSVVDNAAERGGGLYVLDGTVEIRNSIVATNRADADPDVFLEDERDCEHYVYASRALSSFVDWTNASTSGVINYVYDASRPLFLAPEDGDYRLVANSQAIDKGDNSYVTSNIDLEGKGRIQNEIVDLGAFERLANSLDAPGVSVSATDSSVSLDIRPVPNATKYVVQYSLSENFANYSTKQYSNLGSKTITGLTSGRTYYFRVKATADSYSDSEWTSFEVAPQNGVNSLVVSTTVDSATTVGSLRYALSAARPGDVITFADSMKGRTIVLDGAQLAVTKSITVDASAIWDEENDAPGVSIDADRRSRVLYISGDAKLEGLLIEGGYNISSFSGGLGGGAYVHRGSPELANCVVSDNLADQGGGLYVQCCADVLLTNVEVANNNASRYGSGISIVGGTVRANAAVVANNGSPSDWYASEAIFSDGGTSIFHGCAILDNCGWGYNGRGDVSLTNCDVSGNGEGYSSCGGLFFEGKSASLTNCVVSNNIGCGISIDVFFAFDAPGAVLSNCLITGNYGKGSIVGSYSYSESDLPSVVLSNCTIADNVGGLYVVRVEGGIIELRNSIVAMNGEQMDVELETSSNQIPIPTIDAYCVLSSYTDWSNASDSGVVNYVYDPSSSLFVDPDNGDYRLAEGSQAIDLGDNSFVENEFDLDCASRVQNGIVDLGAYEFAAQSLSAPAVSSISTTKTAVTFKIAAVENATSYALEYGTDPTFATCSTKPYASVGSKTISGLTSGTTYYFRVKATASDYDDSDWTTFEATTQREQLSTPTLTAGATTTDSVTLTIGSVSNATGYVLERSKTSNFASVVRTSYTKAGLKTINGLDAGTTYYFRVKATGDRYDDSAWKTVSATTLDNVGDPLETPTIGGLSGTKTAIVIKFNEFVEGAQKYVVEYATDASFSDAVAKPYSSAGSKTISGLTTGTWYFVRVKATATGRADSPYTATRKIFTGGGYAMPAASFSAVKTSITLNIKAGKIDASQGAPEKYVIEYSENPDFSNAKTKTVSQGINDDGTLKPCKPTLSGLTFGTKYYIRVKAIGAAANDSAWNSTSYTAGQLGVPSRFASSVGSDYVNVKCYNVTNMAGFEVMYSTSSDFSDPQYAQGPASGTVAVTGLQSSTKYYFKARALGDNVSRVNSAWSPSFSATTKEGVVALESPTLATTSYANKIDVNIGSVANASSYFLEYGTNANFTGATSVSYGTSGKKTISNLSSGTTYYFRVKATGIGYSDSAWRTATAATTSTALAVPTASTTAQKNSIVVRINAVADATNYVLEYGTDPTFATKQTKSYASVNTAKTISGLTAGTQYYFRLKATASGYNDSAWNEFDARTTGLIAPSVTFSVTKTAVVLNIGAVADATSYVVEYGTDSTFATKSTQTWTAPGVKTISGLSSGTDYYFRVKAVSTTYGESDWVVLTPRTNSGTGKSAADSAFENYFEDELDEIWDVLSETLSK